MTFLIVIAQQPPENQLNERKTARNHSDLQ